MPKSFYCNQHMVLVAIETFGRVGIAEIREKLRTNLKCGVSALHIFLGIPWISGHAKPYMVFTVSGSLNVLLMYWEGQNNQMLVKDDRCGPCKANSKHKPSDFYNLTFSTEHPTLSEPRQVVIVFNVFRNTIYVSVCKLLKHCIAVLFITTFLA